MPLNQALRKNSNILWTISLIQDISPEAQTKSEFSEMAEDILSTQTIEKVSLCLASHLQRFRLMIKDNISEKEAIDRCKKMESEWHENNRNALEKLKEKKTLSFLSWDEFMQWEEYKPTIQKVETLYKENREFRNDVDGRVRQELNNIKDAKLTDISQQSLLLKQYLFEECAFQKFACSKRFNYEVYKTPMNKAMRRIKNNSEFVVPGFMLEVHFTQFNPSAKKHLTLIKDKKDKNENEVDSSSSTTSYTYKPLFNNGKSEEKTISSKEEKSSSTLNEKKIANFIEGAIGLVPIEQRENAIKALIQFTNQKIIPMAYENLTQQTLVL